MWNTQNLCTWIFYRLYLASSLHIKGTGLYIYVIRGGEISKWFLPSYVQSCFGWGKIPKNRRKGGGDFTFGAHQIQLSSWTYAFTTQCIVWRTNMEFQEFNHSIGIIQNHWITHWWSNFYFFPFHATNITILFHLKLN